VVTQCRRTLEQAIGEVLQGRYGIHTSGEVEPPERLTHLTPQEQQYRERVRVHLEHIKSSGLKPKDAVAQLVREAAFTHLNRLCAYKLMSQRGLMRDAVGKALKSSGFLFYLADHPEDEALYNGGEQETAYKHFFEWLNARLSEEIGVLFSSQDVASGLFPPHRVLESVLELLNHEELKPIWAEDETIGWVYQYFTPKELRDQARKESAAPRNSYEMAFRNQFFTPRYVVEFLTDNTLGRTWSEMRGGDTGLKDKCRYLAVDVGGGRAAAGAVTRRKKDPREIKVLDPACGSGHFLLYCFDLLQTIYEEAYTDAELGPQLQQEYPEAEAFKRAVPGLILAHNLHGIDIDLRVTQLAALALWLRAQRAFKELGLKDNRPKVTRMNLVCAEPMPGEEELLDEFIAEELNPHPLGGLMGGLVRNVFARMKLAGEAGALVRIEDDISEPLEEARKTWLETVRREQERGEELTRKGALFDYTKEEPQQRLVFNIADITSERVWHDAESRVVTALRDYVRRAGNGEGLRRRLFAEDAEQGFAFIEMCRQKFDVVLMNPPFGEPTPLTKDYIAEKYPDTGNNLYSAFHDRAKDMSPNGMTGLICSRTFITYRDFSDYREKLLLSPTVHISAFADLGWEVLDGAQVETAAFITAHGRAVSASVSIALGPFVRLLDTPVDKKAVKLNEALQLQHGDIVFWKQQTEFNKLQGSPLCYWSSDQVVEELVSAPTLQPNLAYCGLGASPHAFFFRLAWEVPATAMTIRWRRICRGGDYSPFFRDNPLLIDWLDNGRLVKDYILQVYPYLKGNYGWKIQDENQYGKPGLTYGKRNERFNVQIMPADHIFTDEGQGIIPIRETDRWFLLGYLNSALTTYFLSLTSGLQKHYIYIRPIPVFEMPAHLRRTIEQASKLVFETKRVWSTGAEETSLFVRPWGHLISNKPVQDAVDDLFTEHSANTGMINNQRRVISEASLEPLNASELEHSIIRQDFEKLPDDLAFPDWRGLDKQAIAYDAVNRLISYAVGCAFGRWDVRFATGGRPAPELPDPFAPLPVCAPGALTGADGLPLDTPPQDYPLRADRDGILVDDPEHGDDLVARLREVFDLIWPDSAEAREREACELLGVKTLRDYLRRPAAGGFWTDHVKRYSKSRRKAPIYWLLQSSKKNYAVWLYYHRLDKDILFKVLLNYVEPKIRLEESALTQFRAQREAAGAGGREAKQLEKQLERHEAFLSELHDFRDKLQRAANLNLEPELNDGVVLNIAPLWELVPWAEAKKYWEELKRGKYEWSTIVKQLRARGLVQT
jgi:hypothetical protein